MTSQRRGRGYLPRVIPRYSLRMLLFRRACLPSTLCIWMSSLLGCTKLPPPWDHSQKVQPPSFGKRLWGRMPTLPLWMPSLKSPHSHSHRQSEMQRRRRSGISSTADTVQVKGSIDHPDGESARPAGPRVSLLYSGRQLQRSKQQPPSMGPRWRSLPPCMVDWPRRLLPCLSGPRANSPPLTAPKPPSGTWYLRSAEII